MFGLLANVWLCVCCLTYGDLVNGPLWVPYAVLSGCCLSSCILSCTCQNLYRCSWASLCWYLLVLLRDERVFFFSLWQISLAIPASIQFPVSTQCDGSLCDVKMNLCVFSVSASQNGESDRERANAGRGGEEGDLHSICQGLQRAAQEGTESVYSGTKV